MRNWSVRLVGAGIVAVVLTGVLLSGVVFTGTALTGTTAATDNSDDVVTVPVSFQVTADGESQRKAGNTDSRPISTPGVATPFHGGMAAPFNGRYSLD